MRTVERLCAVKTHDGDLLTHSLTAAWAARLDRAPSSLVAAALLHDIGHVFDLGVEDESWSRDEDHAARGADWLEPILGKEISEPIRLHVDAKRYIAAKNPAQLTRFSDGAIASLNEQGGPMSTEECLRFERSPYFSDAIKLRDYDDMRNSGAVTDGLESYRSLLTHLAEVAATTSDCHSDVYIGMSADIIHKGHLNILRQGARLGRVTVGLLTDEAIATYKRTPTLDFEHRRQILSALRWVEAVVPQESLDYRPNLKRIRPKYVVHGDDWREGVQAQTRRQVIDTLKEWGGELVELPYTPDISSSQIQTEIRRSPITPTERSALLARQLRTQPLVRAIDAHNGFSAAIGDRAQLVTDVGTKQYDALWSGSFGTAAAKGRPDTGVVDYTARSAVLLDIIEATSKPLLFDGEDGGSLDEIAAIVQSLERFGVSALVLEDKSGPKRNSFTEEDVANLASVDETASKIRMAINARRSLSFLIIARLEGLILGRSQGEVVARALAFEAAGADVILIHSKHTSPTEVVAFAHRYRSEGGALPLACIPTTYCTVSEDALVSAGFSLIVYANQLLRAAFQPMVDCALSILRDASAGGVSKTIAPVAPLLKIFNSPGPLREVELAKPASRRAAD